MERPTESGNRHSEKSEEIKQDIQKDLRDILENDHDISYEEYGERKIVSVKREEKTYKLYRKHGDWVMETNDKDGNYIDSTEIWENDDIKFLEKLFEKDIPDSLRAALKEKREVSYEDQGEKQVVSVKHNGKTYKFYRESREYADWVMELDDEKGNYIDSVDIREKNDVDFLEELFSTPTKEEEIETIREKIRKG
jgi:hypothetical protein